MFLDCPDCGGPVEIVDQLYIGQFHCGRLQCFFGHEFVARTEWLRAQGMLVTDVSPIVIDDHIWDMIRRMFNE